MLPKDERLNLKTDFKWVASGKQVDTKFAKLFIRIGNNQTPKIGIASSSKVFKNATDRNKARRFVSAALQSLYSNLPSNINIVALPKSDTITVKSGDILLELEKALKEVKVIK